MDNPVNSSNLLWSNLSASQRQVGIAPSKLGQLVFDIPQESFNEEVRLQVSNFFAACRLAISIQSEHQYVWKLLTASELPPQILKIAETALTIIAVEETKISKDSDGDYVGISFEGIEYGSPYREYTKMFGSLYNTLIDNGLAHLIHPARADELVNCGIITADASLLDDLVVRLVMFRMHGSYGLRVSESKRELKRFQQEHAEQSAALLGCSVPDVRDLLTVEDLRKIPYDYCQEQVCLIFNNLSAQKKLHVLNLPENELFKYTGKNPFGGPVHEELKPWAKAYHKGARAGSVHFGVIVSYLKSLANADLNTLKCHCIQERLKELNWLIDHTQKTICETKKTWQISLSQLSNMNNEFLPGNFSFISDALTMRILSNAYKTVEKLGAWPFFDEEPPAKKGYMFWNHPTMNAIGNELGSDGHSGASMGFCMRWMQMIRKKGWSTVVKDSLAESASSLGMLPLMCWKVNGLTNSQSASL